MSTVKTGTSNSHYDHNLVSFGQVGSRSAILSLSIFAVLRAWGVSVEERREPFLGGLTAASDRQGRWKCRLCREH